MGARLRNEYEASAQHEAERDEWLANRRLLEQELASESACLAALEEGARQQRQQWQAREFSEQRSGSGSTNGGLREALAQQRHLRTEAEMELRSAQAAFTASQEERRRLSFANSSQGPGEVDQTSTLLT